MIERTMKPLMPEEKTSTQQEDHMPVEHILQPGVEEVISPMSRTKMEVAVAMNEHVTAKAISHIDALKQQDTMQRLLGLAATREGLEALMQLKEE